MIKPYGKRVLVELIEDEAKEVGGLKVAEGARRNKPLKGKVIAGNDFLQDGYIITFSPYGYDEVADGILVQEVNILGFEPDE